MKPSDGYISYIVNPKSGKSSANRLCEQFAAYLTAKGFDVRTNLTLSLSHACQLATDAAVDYECAMVVVVGGDGTVRGVAHGLEGSDKPMLIVPRGTENLLANELGFDERLKTVINAFEGGHTRPLDMGVANGKCFISVAGFGFDGEVISRVAQQRKGHIDHLDYFCPLWRTVWDYKFTEIQGEVEG